MPTAIVGGQAEVDAIKELKICMSKLVNIEANP